jgi:Tfp pilus assembly protein PilF
VVKLKVLPAHTMMLINRGRYLAAFHQDARAVEAYQRALQLDPEQKLAREGLNASLSQLESVSEG